jgi:hypothetical protein
MKVEDVYVQNRRLWVRLHEKGGKRHEMPCHHNLETYLHAYIDGCKLAADLKGSLFQTIGRSTLFRTTIPGPRNNPNPAAQSITDVQILSAFQRCFRGSDKTQFRDV